MKHSGSTAVVTGASRGIGKAIAIKFAQAGYEVWALARSLDALQTLEAEASAFGKIRPLRLDAEKPEDVVAAAGIIAEKGAPAVLVNNAGIAPSAPLAKTSLEEFQRTLTVNTTAPFLLCRELMPLMAQAGGGRVINIASTAAMKGFKYTSAYCASKHALLGLTRALALEFASKAVTVNAVCPGWSDTDMLSESAERISQTTGRTVAEARETLAKLNPMGRLITPGEIAELCLFLASPAASAITGAAYVMDGGETL
jgi:NAD(P)-dependent dehydrogenase (short-subunit alcohol dehydrogenase family)